MPAASHPIPSPGRNHACNFLFCFLRTSSARGGGGGRCQTFSFSLFPCSADHERDWPPYQVVFFGLATNALNVRNNKTTTYINRHAGTPNKTKTKDTVSPDYSLLHCCCCCCCLHIKNRSDLYPVPFPFLLLFKAKKRISVVTS